jgi:hypothetical protein
MIFKIRKGLLLSLPFPARDIKEGGKIELIPFSFSRRQLFSI